jgi:sugar lactone lactonase YvrE
MKNILISISMILISFIGLSQTPRIVFEAPYLYPEGVAFNSKTNLFYVSSVTTGTIGSVDRNGKYKVLYKDSLLKSSFGMKLDRKGDHLWVCISDPNYSIYSDSATFKKMARLISINLTLEKKIADVDLSKFIEGKHFANDLTLDDEGNIYITDSYSPVIYKVDARGQANIFTQSELFKGEDVGLNGIVFHPGQFLLVANSRDGAIFKVDIKDPNKITKVKINTFFPGADGLLLDDQNNLVLIQNRGVNKAFQLTSNDNWESAQIKSFTIAEDRFQYPTTGVMQNGNIYLLNSKLNELSDPGINPSKEFSLQLVKFKPAQ